MEYAIHDSNAVVYRFLFCTSQPYTAFKSTSTTYAAAMTHDDTAYERPNWTCRRHVHKHAASVASFNVRNKYFVQFPQVSGETGTTTMMNMESSTMWDKILLASTSR